MSSEVCDQVRLKPACSSTETSYSLVILDLESIGIILYMQRTTKALRLRGNRFSHGVGQIKLCVCVRLAKIPSCRLRILDNVRCAIY